MCSYVDIPMKTPPSRRLFWFSSLILGFSLAVAPLRAEAQVIFSADFENVALGQLPNGNAAAQEGRITGLAPNALPHSRAEVQDEIARGGKALRLTRDTVSSALQLRGDPADYIPHANETLAFRFDFLVPRTSDTGTFALAPNGNLAQQFLVVYIKHAGQQSFVSLLNSAGTAYTDTSFKITHNVWHTFELSVRFEQAEVNRLYTVYDLHITPDGGARVKVAEGLTTRSFTEGSGLQAILSNQPGQAPATDSITYWDNLHYEVVAVPEASSLAFLLMGSGAAFVIGRRRRKS